MAQNSAKGLLTSVDSLFTTQAERDEAKLTRVEEIPIELIDDFPNHPYKVRMDDSMARLIESVSEYGVLEPALVRPKPDGRYEMVAGHRRKEASIQAQIPVMRCIVQDMTDDQAVIIMVDSNLHREEILPSEKAFAYRMKLEAMKRQGKRTDLTSDPVGQKLRGRNSVDILAEEAAESKSQVQRYIRLTYLIPELLELVDNSVLKEKGTMQIALRPAVELSYLIEQEQQELYDTITTEDCTPSHAQAIKMRQFSQNGRLNMDVILSIMQEEKPNQKEQFKMPKDRISKYFPPGTPTQKIEDTIVKALELYRKRQRDQAR